MTRGAAAFCRRKRRALARDRTTRARRSQEGRMKACCVLAQWGWAWVTHPPQYPWSRSLPRCARQPTRVRWRTRAPPSVRNTKSVYRQGAGGPAPPWGRARTLSRVSASGFAAHPRHPAATVIGAHVNLFFLPVPGSLPQMRCAEWRMVPVGGFLPADCHDGSASARGDGEARERHGGKSGSAAGGAGENAETFR